MNNIIITPHFIKKWIERVGEPKFFPGRVRKKVQTAIRCLRLVDREKEGLGTMAPITWRGNKFFIVGTWTNKRSFVAKTVLDEERARDMKWIK